MVNDENTLSSAPTSTSTLKYDAWNRLVTVTEGSVVQRNEYDGLGRRVVRHDYVADRAIHYYYNESWQVVEERVGVIDDNSDIDGDPLNQYYWHPYYIDALAFRIYDEDVNGAGQVVQHYTHDANFNVTAVLDDDGAVLERYYYTPYGEVTYLEDNFAVASPQESAYGNTHLYTGRERDFETGLQLNRHRFYAAHLGRWVNRDPIGYEGSPYNLYEYVQSDAVGKVDPSGKLLVKCNCCDPAPRGGCRGNCRAEVLIDNMGKPCSAVCPNACAAVGCKWTRPEIRPGVPSLGCSDPSAPPTNWCTFWDVYTGCSKSLCISGCIATGGLLARQCAKLKNPAAIADCILGVSAFSAGCIFGCSRCDQP